jgi:hypothetical protein
MAGRPAAESKGRSPTLLYVLLLLVAVGIFATMLQTWGPEEGTERPGVSWPPPALKGSTVCRNDTQIVTITKECPPETVCPTQPPQECPVLKHDERSFLVQFDTLLERTSMAASPVGHKVYFGPPVVAAFKGACLSNKGHGPFGYLVRIPCPAGVPTDSISQQLRWLSYYGIKVNCDNNLPAAKERGTHAVVHPAFNRHLTHVVEAMTPHINAALQPDLYPEWSNVQSLVLAFPKGGELAYGVEYAGLTAKLLTGRADAVTWKEQLGQERCFETMLVSASVSTCKIGKDPAGNAIDPTDACRFFSTPFIADKWRRFALNELGLKPPPTPTMGAPLRVFLIERKGGGNGGRGIENSAEMWRMLETTPWVDQEFLRTNKAKSDFGALSFRDQISLMLSTDVLIGVHGSGLTNAHWMLPFSVVIEVEPGPFVEAVWMALSSSSGHIFFHYVPEYDNTACRKRVPLIFGNPKRGDLKKCNAKIDIPKMYSLIATGVPYIRQWKRRNHPLVVTEF